jgi:multidrug efflux pump subunit AcrA (membrane-fusion protein)
MQRKRKLALTGALCLVAIAVIVAVVLPKLASGVATASPPDVDVAEVEQKDVALYSEWIGPLERYVNAGVRAQVTGYLLRQDYKEGSLVRKGQLLFEIDDRVSG